VKLLLDTHIWLWALLEPGRLSRKVARELTNGDNELWLSPISVWESCVLARKGRIQLDSDPQDWTRESLAKVPMREAPLTFDVALASTRIKLHHRDPADAFIAATAAVYGLTLITADTQLSRSTDFSVLLNR
jgi:PIN domain nuclease of toxin-antitoxin system